MAFEPIGLQHHTLQGARAIDDLVHHVLEHQRLQRVVLARIAVAAIDHDVRGQLGRFECAARLRHRHRVVIRDRFAAQNQVPVGFARGLRHRHLALAIDAQSPTGC